MYVLVLTEKNVNLSQIYYVLDFSFFISLDDAYYHIHQNDPPPPSDPPVPLHPLTAEVAH